MEFDIKHTEKQTENLQILAMSFTASTFSSFLKSHGFTARTQNVSKYNCIDPTRTFAMSSHKRHSLKSSYHHGSTHHHHLRALILRSNRRCRLRASILRSNRRGCHRLWRKVHRRRRGCHHWRSKVQRHRRCCHRLLPKVQRHRRCCHRLWPKAHRCQRECGWYHRSRR